MKKNTVIILLMGVGFLALLFGCNGINPFEAGGVLPEAESDWIIFSEGNRVKRIHQDGTGLENLFDVALEANQSIRRLHVDRIRQKVYFFMFFDAATPQREIHEYNMDGTGKILLVDFGSDIFRDMKVDPAAGALYYVSDDTIDFQIRKVDLETRTDTLLYSNPIGGTLFIAPDYQGNLFYTFGSDLYKLTGLSGPPSSISITPALGAPTISNFKRNSNVLCVVDGSDIKMIDLSNSSSSVIFTDPGFLYRRNLEINYSGDKIFFLNTDYSTTNELYRLNFDGTGLTEIYSTAVSIGGFDLLMK